jgi:hypothetical protein
MSEASEILTDLKRLATDWLRYGLTVGEASLKSSARFIDDAADELRKFADKLRSA